MTAPQKRATGRLFFANPGPTNIPESVLQAVGTHAVDFHDEGFLALYDACMEGVKGILRTRQHLFFYTGSGHAAWEASLVNLFSSGDRLLMPETGNFSESWARTARALGLEVDTVAADWRRGCDIAAIRAALEADPAHRIRAVCVVHNETSTGVMLPVAQVRAAMDAARHPALLLVDTISSLGSIDFRMDEWGVDCAVGASQKGLMLPTGLSFTGVSDKAMAAHAQARFPRVYFDWATMLTRRHKSFVGTVPTNLFHGLRESLRLIEAEGGIDAVLTRHHRLAAAVRACVRHWSGNAGPQLFCTRPERDSDSVTTVLMPEGHDPEAVRRATLRCNVSLGGGLSQLAGKAFRIGHLGDLNEPMVLGTLGTVELALRLNGVPHASGGVEAAVASLAA